MRTERLAMESYGGDPFVQETASTVGRCLLVTVPRSLVEVQLASALAALGRIRFSPPVFVSPKDSEESQMGEGLLVRGVLVDRLLDLEPPSQNNGKNKVPRTASLFSTGSMGHPRTICHAISPAVHQQFDCFRQVVSQVTWLRALLVQQFPELNEISPTKFVVDWFVASPFMSGDWSQLDDVMAASRAVPATAGKIFINSWAS
jgi:hypothetical protein